MSFPDDDGRTALVIARGEGYFVDARSGILLAGGGTLLRGLPALVTQRTGMAVSLADSPLTCVAIGSGLALEHFDQIATNSLPRR